MYVHEITSVVSIHAPTGGATLVGWVIRFWWMVSIHAPTGGATTRRQLDKRRQCFNPRAHGGRDSRRISKLN